MSSVAYLSTIGTKFQVGVAASALAIAVAVPTVAQAAPHIAVPIAPLTQIVAGPVLGPVTFAEQTVCPVPGSLECSIQGAFEGFAALILTAVQVGVELVLLPVRFVLNVVQAVVEAIANIFRPGPYGTGV
ncbi:hypothetical protein [Mycolicibacterium tusciae]|uniref:hypothetical protein n=1 Tax=Mycolicibacterium tusciae TaxID=75922 RepID=UPI00024A506F|nr:hypothetical protein [Mycolicibacterium tusciae]